MSPDREVDARGLRCPLPSLRARKALAGMREGEVLRLLADDPMAAIDLPHLCAEGGHAYLGVEEDAHLLRRGPERKHDRAPA
jgi:tRNA 2-thiouridine synthesizing protein A